MTQYNTLNVKLSDSQLNELKSGIKNGTAVTVILSSNVIGNSNDETNFPYRLLTDGRISKKLRKAFANKPSANINYQKSQLSKIVQLGGFLSRLLGPLLEIDLALMKSF